MLFTHLSLPQGQPLDLSKSFDALSTSPETANKINQLQQMRNMFYSGISDITTKNPTEIITAVDFLNFMPYLQAGPDLLEIGVKNANYPINFSYQPFSWPSKVVDSNNGKQPPILTPIDTEVACTMEIVFTRYLLALGVNRSCAGHVHQVRNSIAANNTEGA